MKALSLLLVALAVLALAGQARADASGERVRLAWVRGAGSSECIDQPTLEAKIVKRLGRPAFDAAAPTSIEAIVERDSSGFRALILVRAESSKAPTTRELTSTSDTCAALEAAVTLAIALVIDPDAPLTEAEPSAPPRTAQPAPTAPAPPPVLVPTPARVSPEPRASFSASLALRAMVAAGLLPKTAPGFDATFSLGKNRWLLPTVSALLLTEQRTSDERFAFGLTVFGLGACAQSAEPKPVRARLCGSFLAGTLHSVVYELLPTRPGQRFWAGAALGTSARVPLFDPVFFELGGEALVPFTRESFTVRGEDGAAFRGQIVAFRGFGGVGLDFP